MLASYPSARATTRRGGAAASAALGGPIAAGRGRNASSTPPTSPRQTQPIHPSAQRHPATRSRPAAAAAYPYHQAWLKSTIGTNEET